jgi:serine/threonine-protein kinase
VPDLAPPAPASPRAAPADAGDDARWLAAAFAPAALGGRYQAVRELGRGSTGVVVLARERLLHRVVALKLLRPELAAVPAAGERFRREARILAQLAPHPGVVACLGYDELSTDAGPLAVLAMAYAPGETLAERLAARGRLPWAEAARVLVALAATLAHAHRHGVVHRDLKPENVLLAVDALPDAGEGAAAAPAGRVLLTDFGVAARPAHDDPRGADHSAGTPLYMAPEQFAGEHAADPRSDVYALGALGYALLSGAPPFAGRSAGALAVQHMVRTVPPLAERAPGAPAALVAAVERCLAKEPDARWATAAELGAALGAAVGGAAGRPGYPGVWARLRAGLAARRAGGRRRPPHLARPAHAR